MITKFLISFLRRNRVFTIFFLSIPVGSALGFGLAALLQEYFNDWRDIFLVIGVPSAFIALLVLCISEPPRGTFDASIKSASWKQSIRYLMYNKNYVYAVIGCVCLTFAVGGFADWSTQYFERVGGVTQDLAPYYTVIFFKKLSNNFYFSKGRICTNW